MRHINIYIAALLAILCMAGCSSDDIKYEPGQPVDADNWGVYFDGGNKNMFPRNPADPNVLEFTLKRMNTKGALEVPLEIDVTKGTFNAPSKVAFADGQEAVTFEVTYEGLEQGKLSATLSLPESYTNPYKMKNGFFKQAISVFEPVVVCSNIVFEHNSFTGVKHDILGNVTSRILQVPGENYFFWENFLGSGITLAFKLDIDNGGTFDKKNVLNSDGCIIPLNHAYDDGEYGWTLCEEENPTDDEATCATWTPEGTDTEIEEAYFYYYYNGQNYLYIDFWDESYDVWEYITDENGNRKRVKTSLGGWGSIWAAVLNPGDDDQYDNFYFYMYYPNEDTENNE